MNEDNVKGTAQDLAGKAKDTAGSALGDTKLQAEGKLDKAAGSAKDALGDAKDTARELSGDVQGEITRLRGEVERLMRDRVGPALSDAAGTASEYAGRARDVATRQGEQAAAVVRENPLLTVGLVAGVAFLLGRVTGSSGRSYGPPWR